MSPIATETAGVKSMCAVPGNFAAFGEVKGDTDTPIVGVTTQSDTLSGGEDLKQPSGFGGLCRLAISVAVSFDTAAEAVSVLGQKGRIGLVHRVEASAWTRGTDKMAGYC